MDVCTSVSGGGIITFDEVSHFLIFQGRGSPCDGLRTVAFEPWGSELSVITAQPWVVFWSTRVNIHTTFTPSYEHMLFANLILLTRTEDLYKRITFCLPGLGLMVDT
jgi:hypothetical protein